MISRVLICTCGEQCEYCEDCGNADCNCTCEDSPLGPAICADCRFYVAKYGERTPPSERFCLALHGTIPRDPVTGCPQYYRLPRCADRNDDGRCPDFKRPPGILQRLKAWILRTPCNGT